MQEWKNGTTMEIFLQEKEKMSLSRKERIENRFFQTSFRKQNYKING